MYAGEALNFRMARHSTTIQICSLPHVLLAASFGLVGKEIAALFSRAKNSQPKVTKRK
jgi:hypothetical protein